MSDAAQDRAKAAELPDGDVIGILLQQHAQIRDMFDGVMSADGKQKQQRFDELRGLLAVHETAEEMVLRPVSEGAAGKDVAKARNDEEAQANVVLKELEKLDVTSTEFDTKLAGFRKSVEDHAEAEETQEFPQVLSSCDESRREAMGRMVKAAEAVGPTHPHPSAAGSPTAQWMTGPFASLVDRTRDAIKAVMP
jgi:hemerythrin superfamily protein